jgi:hypothetical protein
LISSSVWVPYIVAGPKQYTSFSHIRYGGIAGVGERVLFLSLNKNPEFHYNWISLDHIITSGQELWQEEWDCHDILRLIAC